MAQIVSLYVVAFFVIECMRNSRRIQRIIARTYVNDLDDKLSQASWMMLMVGIVLTFSSSPIYLPAIICVKVFAGIFVEYMSGRRQAIIQMGHIDSAKRLIFPKVEAIAHNAPKLLNYGGPNESYSRH